MKKMIAMKSMRYQTRRLRAGDEFDATRTDARVLTALGKAKACDAGEAVRLRVVSAPPAEPKKAETAADPVADPVPQAVASQSSDAADLSVLTNAELRLIAERESVDVSACKVKSDLIAAIEAARNGSEG